MKFHEKLYTLRKAANMTQSDLAEKLDVSRQAVSRWEMGTAKPEVDTLISISDLFGVTLDDLLKNQEEIPQDYVEPPASAPQYWDYVPKKWWVFAVATLTLRLIPQFLVLLILNNPGYGMQITQWMTVLNALQMVFLWLLLGCFLWALVKWLQARKKRK